MSQKSISEKDAEKIAKKIESLKVESKDERMESSWSMEKKKSESKEKKAEKQKDPPVQRKDDKLEEMVGDGEFTMEQKANARRRLQYYREAFYILDDDLSGVLEKDEIDYFGRFMVGSDWSADLLEEFMAIADKDNSGGLALEEFTVFCEYCITDQSE